MLFTLVLSVSDTFQAAELGQLCRGNEGTVVLGIGRVLVLQLGHQQLQEVALAQALAAGSAADGIAQRVSTAGIRRLRDGNNSIKGHVAA